MTDCKEIIYEYFLSWIQNTPETIDKYFADNSVYTVEWYFECDYLKNISRFNGVSVIKFDKQRKIAIVKEFQSKAEHIYPYKDIH